MMQILRVVIVLAVVTASVLGFAAWMNARPATLPPATGAPDKAAENAEPPSATGQAHADLAHLQEKLAAAIKSQRNPAAALADARALVDRYPDFAPGHVTLAQVLTVSGETQEAYAHLARAVELDPAIADVHDLAGSMAIRLRKYVEAQRHYADAVGLEPRNAKYRLHLAVAQLRADRFEEARTSILKATQLDSTSHQAYALLADVHMHQNKIDQALDALNRALELVGDEATYRDNYLRRKASLLRRANRPDEALTMLRQLPPKRWAEREVIDEFAQTYMMLGQPEKAAEHYEAVLPLDPLADWAAERAAHYRIEAGQHAIARQDLEVLRRINPRAAAINEIEAALREAKE